MCGSHCYRFSHERRHLGKCCMSNPPRPGSSICKLAISLIFPSLFMQHGDSKAAQERDTQAVAQIEGRFKGKVVSLRRSLAGSFLRFDQEGKLVDGGKPGIWSLDTSVEIKNLVLDGDKLRIDGNRVALQFDAS